MGLTTAICKDCLKDADISIRKRALDVTYSLVDETNIKSGSHEQYQTDLWNGLSLKAMGRERERERERQRDGEVKSVKILKFVDLHIWTHGWGWGFHVSHCFYLFDQVDDLYSRGSMYYIAIRMSWLMMMLFSLVLPSNKQSLLRYDEGVAHLSPGGGNRSWTAVGSKMFI